jgi:hypothetical protein
MTGFSSLENPDRAHKVEVNIQAGTHTLHPPTQQMDREQEKVELYRQKAGI